MSWRIQRDPDGTPRRLVWLDPEMEEANRKRLKENRTLRYVEPNPFGPPTTLPAPVSVTEAVSLALPFGEDVEDGRGAYSDGVQGKEGHE